MGEAGPRAGILAPFESGGGPAALPFGLSKPGGAPSLAKGTMKSPIRQVLSGA